MVSNVDRLIRKKREVRSEDFTNRNFEIGRLVVRIVSSEMCWLVGWCMVVCTWCIG
jgi:hypothetical protein